MAVNKLQQTNFENLQELVDTNPAHSTFGSIKIRPEYVHLIDLQIESYQMVVSRKLNSVALELYTTLLVDLAETAVEISRAKDELVNGSFEVESLNVHELSSAYDAYHNALNAFRHYAGVAYAGRVYNKK